MPIAPSPLRTGDTIGLFAPAGPLRSANNSDEGIKILQQHGFFVKSLRTPVQDSGYLAGSDQERADELHRLIADEQVKALVAVRGGFGCLRILELLDYNLLRRYPKPIIGFSDLTALLTAITLQTGLTTFHGPVLTSLPRSDSKSRESFFQALTGALNALHPGGEIEVLRRGVATGLLFGGNLTTLIHLVGTPWEPPWRKTILFLEDTGEQPYRLDRMLTQLRLSGKLAGLSGLLLGDFDLGGDDRLMHLRLQEDLWQRVLELTADYNYPVWGNFPIGHLRRNVTLPVGRQCLMDSNTATLHFV